tara:strand:+ start:161 stop:433 length:273 start_codon:yes stop_codon:yes gene_type:complete
MIIQLPSGKTIECSVEIYLSLSDAEINELNGLSVQYTSEESNNPFYRSFADKSAKKSFEEDLNEEYEPNLYEIDDEEKRRDRDFYSDDIE